MSRDRLKVHQVVARGQRGHPLDALLTIRLFRVHRLLLLLDGGHVDLAQVLGLVEVLVQGIGRVNRVKFLGRIFAGVFENDLLAAGMFYSGSAARGLVEPRERTWQELGDVVRLAVYDDPARVLGVVFSDGRAG